MNVPHAIEIRWYPNLFLFLSASESDITLPPNCGVEIDLAKDFPVFAFESRRFFPLDANEDIVWGPCCIEYGRLVTRVELGDRLGSKTTSLVGFMVEVAS